jgi:hypothetical protein
MGNRGPEILPARDGLSVHRQLWEAGGKLNLVYMGLSLAFIVLKLGRMYKI